jgi:hypothetical protein
LAVLIGLLIGCSGVQETPSQTPAPTISPTPTGAVPTPAPSPTAVPDSWIFVCGGISIPHAIDSLVVDDDGTFTGTGHFTIDPSYTWDLVGTMTGDAVSWSITYTGAEAGFVYSGSGTVAPDGALASDVDMNVNSCTEVMTAPGLFALP